MQYTMAIHDVETGEIEIRPYTPEEVKQAQADKKAADALAAIHSDEIAATAANMEKRSAIMQALADAAGLDVSEIESILK